jgi:galactoside O-acetyltransferase
LKKCGIKGIGEDVLLSRKASVYGVENIKLGNHVRIDDFCILSGYIELGNYIHIAAYSALFGGTSGIVMEDFSTVSSRCVIYALSDDYSGQALTNPMVDDIYRNVFGGLVTLKRHVIVGIGSSIMPGVTLEEGVAVGSVSLVDQSLEAGEIYVGIPCRRLKDRIKNLLELEKKFLQDK